LRGIHSTSASKTALDVANNEDIRNLPLSHKKDEGLRGLLGDVVDIRRDEVYAKVRSAAQEQSKDSISAGNLDPLIANLGRVLDLNRDADTIKKEEYQFRLSMILPAGVSSSVMDDLGSIRSALFDEAKAAAIEEGSLEYGVSQLMVVGEGAAGKSSLIRAVTKRPFKMDWDSTVGVRKEDLTTMQETALVHDAGCDTSVVSTAEWRAIDRGGNEMDRAAVHHMAVSQTDALFSKMKERHIKKRMSVAAVSNPEAGSAKVVANQSVD
jgi:hypothetical protein